MPRLGLGFRLFRAGHPEASSEDGLDELRGLPRALVRLSMKEGPVKVEAAKVTLLELQSRQAVEGFLICECRRWAAPLSYSLPIGPDLSCICGGLFTSAVM